MFEIGLNLDIIATMSMAAEEAVTMQLMYRQLMVMSQRLDAFCKDLRDVKNDVHAIKESNKSTSSSNRRVMCPLGCGADFKRVSELQDAV